VNSANPLRWSAQELAAWLAVIIVGAVAGVAFGWGLWALSVSTVPPIRNRLINRTSDVVAWALIGAVVAGGLGYARRVLSSK
jgi:hypothetical protein